MLPARCHPVHLYVCNTQPQWTARCNTQSRAIQQHQLPQPAFCRCAHTPALCDRAAIAAEQCQNTTCKSKQPNTMQNTTVFNVLLLLLLKAEQTTQRTVHGAYASTQPTHTHHSLELQVMLLLLEVCRAATHLDTTLTRPLHTHIHTHIYSTAEAKKPHTSKLLWSATKSNSNTSSSA